MCILFLALGVNDRFPVILASNRDEDLKRRSEVAHFWNESELVNGTRIIGGIDGMNGGTWLAASNRGRIGTILNCTQPVELPDQFLSRGEIVSSFVRNEAESREEFQTRILKRGREYKPFNFVGIEYNNSNFNSFVITQPSVDDSAFSEVISTGTHVVGNVPYGHTPLRKMVYGKQLFDETISTFNSSHSISFELLQKTLIERVLTNSDCCYPDAEYDRIWKISLSNYSTNVSRVFVCIPQVYQTRCSTVVAIDKSGACHFVEYSWAIADALGDRPSSTHITHETFQLIY